jgi:glyceraldehyde 3-phosphate dehydrogenase
MAIRVAVNGFGRIGRLVLRAAKVSGVKDIDFVAVNDLTDTKTLAHLLRYDSVHRAYPGTVETSEKGLVVDGDEIAVFSERDPAKLPWKELGVDIVIESTGFFTKRDDAAKHLSAGARKVIISAPGKNEDITVVLGVNEDAYDPDRHDVVSNASCTTNCLAPVAKVLHQRFGIVRGLMTTIHAYTNDQALLDAPHKDLRRARAAALSMIPTTTGAARATSLVLPELEGRLDGLAIRVPTPDVSLVDLVAQLERDATAEEVNGALRDAAEGPLKGILEVSDVPLVSVDFTGNPHSSIVDAATTSVIGGGLVKVLSWYDNEMGYSHRCVDLARYMGERLPARSGG